MAYWASSGVASLTSAAHLSPGGCGVPGAWLHFVPPSPGPKLADSASSYWRIFCQASMPVVPELSIFSLTMATSSVLGLRSSDVMIRVQPTTDDRRPRADDLS